YMLGQLYQNRGNTDKAVAEFTKHIRIHETGGMVEDAMHRIAEMKGMTFEQVKELFDQYIEKKPEPKPAAAPVMEKRDEKDYLKNLKEKMAAKKEPAMPTEQPPAKPATPVQPAGKAIDPQEYMRQLKAKMQQKKSGAIPDQPLSAVKITQTGYSIPKQPAIRQAQPVSTVREAGHTGNVPVQSAASDAGPRAEDSGLHEISLPPPPPAAPVYQPSSPPVISTQMAEPTIERIDDDIPVVDLDSPAPSSGNNHSGIAPSPNFMETIIKPVGTDAPLPTDKMPEFHEQPSPGRNIPPAQGTAHNQASAPKKDDEPPAGPKIKHNYW
ncbi:MAG TPA: hypothetical protein P5511_06505, partial [Candidatus Goldiibacteriota bacterium]|nr:hypothetical protein [Candidatus Goldiibacteriota bacterium]